MPSSETNAEELKRITREHRLLVLAGKSASIDQLVADHPGFERDPRALLRLVLVDFATRTERGDQPTIEEYRRRFPKYAANIEKLLREKQGEINHLRRDASAARNPTVQLANDAIDTAPTVVGPRDSAQAAAKPSRTPIPKRLGRFELRELLGRGAFGAVYRAHDPQLDREVALKTPHVGTIQEEADAARFLREARAAGQLRHPNIVPIFDAGQIEDTCYISCGFIAGKTLQAEIKDREKLPPREAAQLVSKLAQALHYAHSKGIVHRDVKPANIMLDADGEPVLMDFGLARRDSGETLRTMEGACMGTPRYMSPEQAGGKSHLADGKSDQWSLGVLLYELLSGQTPFQGNVAELFWRIGNQEPALLRTHDRELPRDLENICSRCLQKQPENRYPSCEHLAADLERYLAGDPVSVRPISLAERFLRWSRRNPIVAGLSSTVALLVLAVAVVLGYATYTLNQKEQALAAALGATKELAQKQSASLKDLEAEIARRNQAEADRAAAEAAAGKASAQIDTLAQERAQEETARRAAEAAASEVSSKLTAEEEKRREAEEKRKAAESKVMAEEERRKVLANIADLSAYVQALESVAGHLKSKEYEPARFLLDKIDPEQRKWEWKFLNHLAVTLERPRPMPLVIDLFEPGIQKGYPQRPSSIGSAVFNVDDSQLAVLLAGSLYVYDLTKPKPTLVKTVPAEALTTQVKSERGNYTNSMHDMFWTEEGLFLFSRHRIIQFDLEKLRLVRAAPMVDFPGQYDVTRVRADTNVFGSHRYLALNTGWYFFFGSTVCRIEGVRSRKQHTETLTASPTVLSWSGEFALCVGREGKASIVQLRTGKGVDLKFERAEYSEAFRLSLPPPQSAYCFCPGTDDVAEDMYCAVWRDGDISVFNTRTGTRETSLKPHYRWMAKLGFGNLAPDGTSAIVNDTVVDLETGRTVFHFNSLGDQYTGLVRFSPTRRWIIFEPRDSSATPPTLPATPGEFTKTYVYLPLPVDD